MHNSYKEQDLIHSSQYSAGYAHYVSSYCIFINITEAILEKIMEAGFKVAYQKELTLTKEQAEVFYKEHKDKEFFESLTTHMSRLVKRVHIIFSQNYFLFFENSA